MELPCAGIFPSQGPTRSGAAFQSNTDLMVLMVAFDGARTGRRSWAYLDLLRENRQPPTTPEIASGRAVRGSVFGLPDLLL